MAVVLFPDRRPLPDPSPLLWLVADLWAELQEVRAELERVRRASRLSVIPGGE